MSIKFFKSAICSRLYDQETLEMPRLRIEGVNLRAWAISQTGHRAFIDERSNQVKRFIIPGSNNMAQAAQVSIEKSQGNNLW
jgi:hypothetical protein